jgi:hypothetical protein
MYGSGANVGERECLLRGKKKEIRRVREKRRGRKKEIRSNPAIPLSRK